VSWLYRVLEGTLIAALWFLVTMRREIRYRRAVQVVLLISLAVTVVFHLEVYKAPLGEITALVLLAPLVLLTVIVHEISHGWVALQLGDPTAKDQGRLTLNPLKHMSFRWTVLFPITTLYLFTVALILPKPVPINPRNFENPRRDIMWVGVAGPAVNIFFMLFFALILGSGVIPAEGIGAFVRLLLTILIIVNMVLASFNLIPIPPLDGSRLLVGLLPPKQALLLIRGQRVGLGFIFAVVIGTAVFVGIDRVFFPWIKLVWQVLGLDVIELENMLAG
jgi:Zn-dependent protease